MNAFEDPDLLDRAVPRRGTPEDDPPGVVRPELIVEFLRRRGMHDAVAEADGSEGVLVTFGWPRRSEDEVAVVYLRLDELRAAGLTARARRSGLSRGLAGFRVRRAG